MAMLLATRQVEAHGEGGTVQRLGQAVAGHDVTVRMTAQRPRVGTLHVAVQLIDPRDLTYIATATVTATARYLCDETVRVRATRSRYHEPWHELDLERSGRWRMQLFVDGPNGQGELSFVITISPEPD